MTVYREFLNLMKTYRSYKIDFKNRTLYVGNRCLVSGSCDNFMSKPRGDVKQKLYDLYTRYYYSKPTTMYVPASYFKPCKSDEITSNQMLISDDRLLTQAAFEGYILGLILQGYDFNKLDPNESHWFWQCENTKGLVLLREWFKEKTNG